MTLFRKFTLAFGALALATIAGIGYYGQQAARRVLVADLRHDAEKQSRVLLAGLRPGLEARSERLLLPRLQDALPAVHALYAAAVSTDNVVLAHTDVAAAGRRLPEPPPETRETSYHDQPVLEISVPVLSWSGGDSSEAFVLSGEAHGGKQLGTLRLGLPLDDTIDTQRRIARALTYVIVTAAGLGLLAAMVFMRGLLRPLREVADAAEQIGAGRYGVTVRSDRGDELGEMLARFNRMSEELARTTVSKDHLAQIFESLLDALFVTDAAGIVTMANPAALRVLGCAERDLLGRDIRGLFVQSGDSVFSATRGAEVVARNIDLTLRARDGVQVPVLLSTCPLGGGGAAPRGIVWVAKDMTDRKRAEEAQALKERELMHKDFVATVSHELRAPITAIRGFAESLLGGGLDDKDCAAEFARTIERNAERLARLVDNLFTLAVLETGKRLMSPEPLELSRFAKDFAGTLAPITTRAGMTVVVTVPPRLKVLADPAQLAQVFQNLIDNAVKFSAAGASITIGARVEGGHAVVTVSDTGRGIAPEHLPAIFERFERAGETQIKGAGLGLSIVKQIVELHGGRVSCDSRLGHGTTFSFTLPLA